MFEDDESHNLQVVDNFSTPKPENQRNKPAETRWKNDKLRKPLENNREKKEREREREREGERERKREEERKRERER